MKKIDLKKKDQRKISLNKRATLNLNNENASKVLQNNLKDFIHFKNCKIIASYFSINSEISTKFLNKFILDNNKILCLPVIKKHSDALIFREYNLKTKLISNKFGIMEPTDFSNELLPEIILTPCLAFDNKGFRLGYGGGYYDRTFSNLTNNQHEFISILVAFKDQRVQEVMHDKHDQKINYILTEKKLYKIL